jgi:hypothetical protein
VKTRFQAFAFKCNLYRYIEVFERASATGVAAEGEGEANMWDEDDDRGPGGLSVEQELESIEAAAAGGDVAVAGDDVDQSAAVGGYVAVAGDDVDQSRDSANASEDWSAAGQQQLDGPVCPIKGAVAAKAPPQKKTPIGEVLAPPALRSIIAAAARCGGAVQVVNAVDP